MHLPEGANCALHVGSCTPTSTMLPSRSTNTGQSPSFSSMSVLLLLARTILRKSSLSLSIVLGALGVGLQDSSNMQGAGVQFT